MSKILLILLTSLNFSMSTRMSFAQRQGSDFSTATLRDQLVEEFIKARESHVPEALTLLGAWLYGPCNSVAMIDSSHLLIGNGRLVQVLDISDTTRATVVGEAKVWSLVFDLTVRWPYAYVVRAGGYLCSV